jgi:phytoene dehydrogenase-like protein
MEFARGIEKRYLELGGRIHYKSKVREITVEAGRATGIRLEDGSVSEADFIISAADGYSTFFKMLDGRYLDDETRALYGSGRTSFTSVQVSLGIDFDLSKEPHSIKLKLDEPVKIGNVDTAHFLFKHFCYDKTICPPGKSVITSLLFTDYGFWEALYSKPMEYKAEKERVAKIFIEAIAKRFPGIRDRIEVVDVATPVTYNRYTGVWKGSYCGWGQGTKKIPVVLPGLQGFYLAGQWASPSGGLPTALMTAKGSVMRVCKDDGREFSTCKG